LDGWRRGGGRGLHRARKRAPRRHAPEVSATSYAEREFFERLIGLAGRHGTMVVHDFAYADICFDGYRAPSILQVEGAREVAVEIFSMSKSYNMAGWRVGFCVGNARMVTAMIALRECEEETRKICAVYQKRREALVKGFRQGGLGGGAGARVDVRVGSNTGRAGWKAGAQGAPRQECPPHRVADGADQRDAHSKCRSHEWPQPGWLVEVCHPATPSEKVPGLSRRRPTPRAKPRGLGIGAEGGGRGA
jgi:hypothetical protein